MTFRLLAFSPLLADQDLWTESVNGLIGSLSLVVSAVGVAVIVWGAYSAAVRLIASETAAARGQSPKAGGPAARLLFLSYLLPGLEFMIAGGVIKTLAVPDWQHAAVLAGLVLARALLGLSVRWETPADVDVAVRAEAGSPLALLTRGPQNAAAPAGGVAAASEGGAKKAAEDLAPAGADAGR
jgi:uncharacterized membrane protein